MLELVDLTLIGKQLHWNVVGPLFRPLHLYLDELVDEWRLGEIDPASEDTMIDTVPKLEEQLGMIREQSETG